MSEQAGTGNLWPLDAEDIAALDDARTKTPLTLFMVAAAMVQKHLRARAGTERLTADELVGAFIQRRRCLGLSLRQVAEQCGVSFNTLSRIERGRNFTASRARLIREWLDDHPAPCARAVSTPPAEPAATLGGISGFSTCCVRVGTDECTCAAEPAATGAVEALERLADQAVNTAGGADGARRALQDYGLVVMALDAVSAGQPDDHDHEWTPCANCDHPGRPCPCSGGRCPECPGQPDTGDTTLRARIEALADEWDDPGGAFGRAAERLRDALAADTADHTDTPPEPRPLHPGSAGSPDGGRAWTVALYEPEVPC